MLIGLIFRSSLKFINRELKSSEDGCKWRNLQSLLNDNNNHNFPYRNYFRNGPIQTALLPHTLLLLKTIFNAIIAASPESSLSFSTTMNIIIIITTMPFTAVRDQSWREMIIAHSEELWMKRRKNRSPYLNHCFKIKNSAIKLK